MLHPTVVDALLDLGVLEEALQRTQTDFPLWID